MRTLALAVIVGLVSWLAPVAFGQDADRSALEDALAALADRLREPATEIERLQAREGALVVTRWERVGVATALRGRGLAVLACQSTDATAGQTLRGVALGLDVRDSRGDDAYVDAGGVEPLLAGIDHILALKRDAANLRDFSAHYETPGGVVVRCYASAGAQGGVAVAIELRTRTGETTLFVELTSDQLTRLRDLIATAHAFDGFERGQ